MRRRFAVLLAIVLVGATSASTGSRRFYDDDPISREPESRDASGAKPLGIGLLYEYTYNLFVVVNRQPSNTRAANVNTIDEVPDSGWFTNRIGAATITPEVLARGANTGPPPAPERWVLLREKSAGTNPGFTARDANGQTWFLQFDRVERPQASTAAVEVATKLFWGLGYNQIETFITTFDPARADIDPKATVRRPSGARTRFTRDDMNRVLERSARGEDGTYRASAGRLLTGTILGPFRYAGTRPDDPNDLVPHEHRRELRALRVFGAWTNLVDMKAGNTLDVLVEENGRSVVKHYLQDVGSTFGLANNPHEWDMGWEHFYEGDATLRRLTTFGFALSPWQTVPYREYPSIGLFEGDRFDPTAWKPQTPVQAFVELRADDAFWAARRVMAFTDELIRAAVHTGQYADHAAERHLGDVLIKRRQAIGRTYLTAVNPIVDPRLDAGGELAFGNAAVDLGFAQAPARYLASWFQFDNTTGETRPLGNTESPMARMRPPPGLLSLPSGSFVEIDIEADSPGHPSWRQPVRTFFRRTDAGWKLVGLERLADRQSATAPPPRVVTRSR
jgi:hypothetical protein